MNESTRTLTFVGVAVALSVAAFGMHAATQPQSLDEFSDVGEEFFPDFREPREATSLRVAAYNEEAARVDVFSVETKNGLWQIPSHHNYPADGEERLAKTATSIIGITRDALVSTSPDDFKRLGVLDPLDESVSGTEGRGDRITLSKGNTTLADYIIGKAVEEGSPNQRYLRKVSDDSTQNEDRTYIATIDIDLSTKFADWIDPNLLDFRRGDVREIVVDRYSIDEQQGVVIPGDQSRLSRTKQDDPWKLDGLDEQVGQVKASTITQMISALKDLKIVGVRPKPEGLSADLRGDGDGAIDRLAMRDLERKGFFIDSRGGLVSNEGDIRMATKDGVMYVLRFGEVFTGSDVEIEIGGNTDAEESPAKQTDESETATESETTGDAAEEETVDEADDAVKKNRYVFMTTQFEESQIDPLPEKPEQPVEPTKPKELDKEETDQTSEAKDDTDEDSAKTKTDTETKTETKAEDTPNPAAEYKLAKEKYELALAEYEIKLEDWEQRKTEREGQVADGEKRVQELNTRFADWYYVISAETFDKLRVSQAELIETKELEADASDKAPAGNTEPAKPSIEMKIEPEAKKEPKAEKDSETKTKKEESADSKPAAKPKSSPAEKTKPTDGDKTSDDASKPDDAKEAKAE